MLEKEKLLCGKTKAFLGLAWVSSSLYCTLGTGMVADFGDSAQFYFLCQAVRTLLLPAASGRDSSMDTELFSVHPKVRYNFRESVVIAKSLPIGISSQTFQSVKLSTRRCQSLDKSFHWRKSLLTNKPCFKAPVDMNVYPVSSRGAWCSWASFLTHVQKH